MSVRGQTWLRGLPKAWLIQQPTSRPAHEVPVAGVLARSSWRTDNLGQPHGDRRSTMCRVDVNHVDAVEPEILGPGEAAVDVLGWRIGALHLLTPESQCVAVLSLKHVGIKASNGVIRSGSTLYLRRGALGNRRARCGKLDWCRGRSWQSQARLGCVLLGHPGHRWQLLGRGYRGRGSRRPGPQAGRENRLRVSRVRFSGQGRTCLGRRRTHACHLDQRTTTAGRPNDAAAQGDAARSKRHDTGHANRHACRTWQSPEPGQDGSSHRSRSGKGGAPAKWGLGLKSGKHRRRASEPTSPIKQSACQPGQQPCSQAYNGRGG